MRKIVIASSNPVKKRATEMGFQRVFPAAELVFEAVEVASGVAHQPMSEAETLRGARQRAAGAEQKVPDADFWVGLEGGVEDDGELMLALAWVAVRSPACWGQARTASFALPERVAELVRGGMELGAANDLVYGRVSSKHGEGAVGILTRGVIDRAELYEPAVVLALIPHLGV